MKAQEVVKAKEASKGVSERGCNCRKSHCQKKYCECFNAGLACGKECKCVGCSNCQEQTHESGTVESKESILDRIAESFLN